MNDEKINSKIKLSNDSFRYFNIRNFEIPKYYSFYIPSFQILTSTPYNRWLKFIIVALNCLLSWFVAPFDFHLFPNLKKLLAEMKFSSIKEMQVAVNEYFGNPEESFFKIGIMTLETRWKKCIKLGGNYVGN